MMAFTEDTKVYLEIRTLILESRESAVRSVNFQLTIVYWNVGRIIVESEQKGKDRAAYGTELLKGLSDRLVPEFGNGFSFRNLFYFRQFYQSFPILNAVSSKLSWTHFRILSQVEKPEARQFYMEEAMKNLWTSRQLERQIHTLFFERSLNSRPKVPLIHQEKKDEMPSSPEHFIRNPYVLEFLGLKSHASYYEKDLEQAIITHLQEFLLELGNGFSFVARQKRIILDGDDFFIDLVFYNRLLQCFLLIDLKMDKITHQDIGQIQMYVNYFDREIRESFENSTIGLLLCADKNESVVKYTLAENNKQIFASKYKLYLPTEKQLQAEIRKEIEIYRNKTVEQ